MQVVVAGGGIAALEALAGLRALADGRVDTTLLAPERSFSYRPLSMATPFTFLDERTRSLGELADGLGATFVRDGLAQVDDARSRILTHNGDFLSYDVLVVATGAHSADHHHGMTWWRNSEGNARFARVLEEIEKGVVRSLALVVPSRAAWPVDAYELALVAALATAPAGSRAKISLITAEKAPLEAFGPVAADAIAGELARAGIELLTGVEATPASIAVDRALFLPAVYGPAIAGTPHDAQGFIPVDSHARALGEEHIYAAGDATALALKHSALSSAQATAAAEAIAARAGAPIEPRPWSPTLYGLLTLPPHFPGTRGSPWLESGEPITHCLWWPPGHVAGRYLAPYLASVDPRIRPGLEWHPNGIPLAIRVDRQGEAAAPAPSPPTEQDISHDALTRQRLAVSRAEHEGEALERALEARGRSFARHEREVVEQLRAAGYLQEH